MDGTLLVRIKDGKFTPVVITLEKGDYHFQTEGKSDSTPKEGVQDKEMTSFEAYQEKLSTLKDMDFKYEIIFPYKPTEEQLRLWIRLFALDKEEMFLREIQKNMEEFENK